MPEELLTVLERLFYDVRDRLDDRDYIYEHEIRPDLESSSEGDQDSALYKAVAYEFGWRVFEAVLLAGELHDCIYMEEHQVKIPGTQMAMVALEHGIQCTWVSHFNVKQVAHVLRLPARYLPSNLLVFGYAEGENPTEGDQQRKRDIQDIVFYNTGENQPPADQVPHWKWDSAGTHDK